MTVHFLGNICRIGLNPKATYVNWYLLSKIYYNVYVYQQQHKQQHQQQNLQK